MNYSFPGVVSTDHEGMFTLANNYCYNLLGVTEQELLGQQLCAWFLDIHYQEVVERGIKILSEIHRVAQSCSSSNSSLLILGETGV